MSKKGTKYPIITLCGSSKFKEDFMRVQKELTLQGNIVLSLGLFSHHDKEHVSQEKMALLKDLHFERILLSDAIYVINKDGYIGSSTKKEIEFAKKNHKQIFYMEKEGEKK